jgi:hypothetical protein
LEFVEPNDKTRSAPVSHQKRPQQSTTNAIKGKRKRSKINEHDRYSAAHNSLKFFRAFDRSIMQRRICERDA